MATPNPLVCIVVPLLNEARYLRESMDSLLAQDYRPLEIVVYDAGSTDGTLDILKSYPVEVIVEPGLGQMAAINRGWQRTTAEFVTWWAGDDRYRPGAISRLVKELQYHSDAGFVHAGADLINEQGDVVFHVDPGPIQLLDLVLAFTMMPQSALIRRSALQRSGMMDETRRLAADWDLFLRLAQYYPIAYAPFTAAERRLHAGSEDARAGEAGGLAGADVVRSFFQRPDLTDEQRRLRRYGLAASALSEGWSHCLSGKRGQAARNLAEAIRTAPSVLWKAPAGWRVLARLVIPFSFGANRWLRFRSVLGLTAGRSGRVSR